MSEFSRLLSLDAIGDGVTRTIEAAPAERAALARRFDLRDIAVLSATLTASPAPDGVRVGGHVVADATQACAVSGEDVPARVDERFEVLLLRDIGAAEEVELDAGGCDVLPLEGGAVDLGEIAAQSFGLALDPYPRASDEVIAAARRLLTSEEEARAASNPFAALKQPPAR